MHSSQRTTTVSPLHRTQWPCAPAGGVDPMACPVGSKRHRASHAQERARARNARRPSLRLPARDPGRKLRGGRFESSQELAHLQVPTYPPTYPPAHPSRQNSPPSGVAAHGPPLAVAVRRAAEDEDTPRRDRLRDGTGVSPVAPVVDTHQHTPKRDNAWNIHSAGCWFICGTAFDVTSTSSGSLPKALLHGRLI